MTKLEINQQPFKTEFEIPTRPITPSQIRKSFEGYRNLVKIDLAQVGSRVDIRLGFPKGANGQGEAFVYFGRLLEGLNGTYMSYGDFVSGWEIVEPKGMSPQKAREILISDRFCENPLLVLRSPGRMLTLNVFGGATHLAAKKLSEIGSEGNFENQDKRKRYQAILAFLYKPLALRSLGNSELIEIISEDCLATADTFIGWQIASRKAAQANGLIYPFSGSRWNLIEATGQGLILAACEADYLKFPVEINVCFVQTGLTEGIGPNKDHKNYITPSPEIAGDYEGRIFAVGDMGDAAKRVEGTEWDKNRADSWGIEGQGENFWSRNLENPGSLQIGFANGGLLMMALKDYWTGETENPAIMLTAKRIDGPCFAARFDNFLEPYFQYLKCFKK